MNLEVKDLHFAYKNNPVLKGVDFSVGSGLCVCVPGENGAGKTTLFRCLLGLLGGYSGGIYFDGVDSRKLTPREIAKKVAYIPQAHAPAFNYTVYETVLMGTNVLMGGFRTPGRDERNAAMETIEFMNISRLSGRGFAELSGGERQLTLIARALTQKSRVLIMDEPTADLDYGNQFRVLRRIRQLVKDDYLVVLSTHNPEHAMLFADMVLVLKDGKALFFGKPDEVLNPATIESIYGVSVEIRKLSTSTGDVSVFLPLLTEKRR